MSIEQSKLAKAETVDPYENVFSTFPDDDLKNADGEGALISACHAGNLAEVELLLSKRTHADGEVPSLHVAVIGGHEDAVELLLNYGAPVDEVDQSNRTALDIAVELNHVLIAELLLDRGASLTSCNESGESLLMRAVVAGHVNMVSLLLEEGADVTYINPADGNTALHLASLGGSAEIVRLLTRSDKKGMHTVNKSGDTARSFATNEHVSSVFDNIAESSTLTRSWYAWFTNATQLDPSKSLRPGVLNFDVERRQVARLLRQVPGVEERLEWIKLRDRLIAVLERVTQDPDMAEEASNLETHLKEHMKRSSQLVLSERHLSTLAGRHSALLTLLEARRIAAQKAEDSTVADEAEGLLEKLRAVTPIIADMPPLVSATLQSSTTPRWGRIIGGSLVIGMVVAIAPVLLAPVGQAMTLGATAATATATAGVAAATIHAAPVVAGIMSPLLNEVWEFAAKLEKNRDFSYAQKVVAQAKSIIKGPLDNPSISQVRTEESEKVSVKSATNLQMHRSIDERLQAVYDEFKLHKQALEAAKEARNAQRSDQSTQTEAASSTNHSNYRYLFPNTSPTLSPDSEVTENDEGTESAVCEPCCPYDEEMSKVAATKGHLRCLRKALELFPVHPQACTCAAAGNHLRCLVLLHEHDAPWDAETTRAAVTGDGAGSLRFLLERDCPYDDDLLLYTAEVGSEWCMKYLIEFQQMEMSVSIFGAAFERANSRCLALLFLNECPFKAYIFRDEDHWHVYESYHDLRADVDEQFLKCILLTIDKSWCVDAENGFSCPNLVNYVQQYSHRFPLCSEHFLREGYILV